jgi:hypothetical protein
MAQVRDRVLSGGYKHSHDMILHVKERTTWQATRERNCVTWKSTKQFPFYYGRNQVDEVSEDTKGRTT